MEGLFWRSSEYRLIDCLGAKQTSLQQMNPTVGSAQRQPFRNRPSNLHGQEWVGKPESRLCQSVKTSVSKYRMLPLAVAADPLITPISLRKSEANPDGGSDVSVRPGPFLV